MASDSKLDDDIIKTEDGLIFNPYNSLNTEITLNDVQSILTRYGLPTKVHNMEFYRRAFVHRSYTKRHILRIYSKTLPLLKSLKIVFL